MNLYKIAVIPGDGVGKEITPIGVKVLNKVGEITGAYKIEYEYFPWGCEYYLSHGRMMEKNALAILQHFDSIYFGAVGFPSVPDHISLRGLRLPICQGFEQYVCQRPSELFEGINSVLVGKGSADINFVVIRENTEGEYSGAGGRVHKELPSEIAVETSVFTRNGIKRVMQYAFELANSRRKKIINATKSNAQQNSMTFWDEIFSEISADYTNVKTERVLIDALAARFVMKPESIDVVVASNLLGDILTDLGAAITGGLGLACSGNINPEKIYPSMFEPVHGSAPDIAGKQKANPIGMIRSGAMMLDFLGEKEAALRIENSVKRVIKKGLVKTPDLGGSATTEQLGQEVVNELRKEYYDGA